MDLKKATEHYIPSLSFKKRVLSGFGVGLLASILLCLFFNFNSNTSSSSALSWFLAIPNAIATHSNNLNSSTNFSTDLGKTHVLNSTASEYYPSKGDFVNNSIIVVKNSSSSVHQESIFDTTHVRGEQITVENNSTTLVNNSSSLVHQESIFNTTHVKGEQIIVENNVHLENSSRNDVTQIVQVNAKSVANDTLMHSNAIGKFDKTCNVFDGRWVRDERHGLYPGGSCPYIDNDFNCYKNGRPDEDFLRWRWQPNGCNIPRMNATDFLARLRNKRLLFVGDSLNRNMWESLVCILRHSVKRKENVYEFHGKHEFKTRGYYSFRFKDYNCSVDFVQSPFLVREIIGKNSNGSADERLRLDLVDATTEAYRTADVIVFNTGHWWTHEKTSKGIDYYQEGNHVYPLLKVMEAYKKALATWAKWVDRNIDSRKTEVIFRGYSLTHYKGGQWNSGGQCHRETEPIYEEKYLGKYPSKMRTLEQILRNMKTPVMYLNISKLTDYRKDGHPSVYRRTYKSIKEQISYEASQDCSHWCLPGIPDTWNELLYVLLLQSGKGSWKQ